jgi:integrase/recombinase XerD
MLENGADIRYIQAMLGHADLTSTQLYTHVSIRKLQEIHTATHPAKLEDKKIMLAQLQKENEEELDS